MSGNEPETPIESLAHIRASPGGDLAMVSPSRGNKPKGDGAEACIFCPNGRELLAKPFLDGDFLDEMVKRELYILDNAYPVTSSDNSPVDGSEHSESLGIYYTGTEARGKHLVMIETNKHDLDPFSAGAETRAYYRNLAWGYSQMLRSLKNEGYAWGGVGKNRNGVSKDGKTIDAGASQAHPHSQAIAMNTFVPRSLEENMQSTRDVDAFLGPDGNEILWLRGCPGCLEGRENNYARALHTNGQYVSFVAPVPKGPNPYHVEIRIVPLAHQSHFEDMSLHQQDSFADILHDTMVSLSKPYPNMGYNFEMRQGPWKPHNNWKDPRSSHWEFSIYPAWPKLDTEKHTGFIPHLIGASVMKISPEEIARQIKGI